MTENKLKEIGIPKEIYEEKGLNYIRKKNYLEVLFIHDMKMVKIYDDLNNIENKSFNNNLNLNINNINHINNINNIVTFAKEKISENNKNLKRESYNRDHLKTDSTSLDKRKISDNINITSTLKIKILRY